MPKFPSFIKIIGLPLPLKKIISSFRKKHVVFHNFSLCMYINITHVNVKVQNSDCQCEKENRSGINRQTSVFFYHLVKPSPHSIYCNE